MLSLNVYKETNIQQDYGQDKQHPIMSLHKYRQNMQDAGW